MSVLDPTLTERCRVYLLYVPWKPQTGKDGVKPSLPLSSLKLFTAQQCAHACHAVIVFFREVTFHLYLKTPDACQSFSLFLPCTLSFLYAHLWNMHLLKHSEACWLLLLTTWSHIEQPVSQLLTQLCTSEAFLSLLWVWVSLVQCSSAEQHVYIVVKTTNPRHPCSLLLICWFQEVTELKHRLEICHNQNEINGLISS